MSAVLRLRDGSATYLSRSLTGLSGLVMGEQAALASLVELAGEFDFDKLSLDEVRSLYEAGRWWERERENMPGVARLRQQVLDGEVGYFMYDNRLLVDKVRRWACFAGNRSGADLVRYFQTTVPGGLARAPAELFTETNMRCAMQDLYLRLWGNLVVPRAGVSWRPPKVGWFALRKWPDCYLMSGDRYRDGYALERQGIRLVDVDPARASVLDTFAYDLFELLRHLPDRYCNNLRLLPSMNTPKRWSECYRNGKLVSSFLCLRYDLCRTIDQKS